MSTKLSDFLGHTVNVPDTFPTDVTFASGVKETKETLSGTSVNLDPSTGTIKLHTLTGNTTYTESLRSGEYVTLVIESASYTVTWPTIIWTNNGGSAPDLTVNDYTFVTVWKVGSVLYGSLIGGNTIIPPELIGGVGAGYNNGSSFDSNNALDVLQYASVGDLVVISVSGRAGSSAGWSWGGMSFTPIIDGMTSNDPSYYVGYKFVEEGDANPYLISHNGTVLSVTATVFRGLSSFVGNTTYAQGNPPPIPELTASAGLWVVASGRWAETTLPPTPSGYSIGASYIYNGQYSNDATSLQSYKIESLSGETPTYTTTNTSWAVLSAFI